MEGMRNDTDMDSDPAVLAARGEVELAKAELATRLRAVRRTGRQAIVRAGKRALPVAGALLALGGVIVVVRAVRSRSRARRWQVEPRAPTLLRAALGAALRVAVRTIAARLAEQAIERLELGSARSATPAGLAACSADPSDTEAVVFAASDALVASCVSSDGAR